MAAIKKEKAAFIDWFLDNKVVKKRQSIWILNVLRRNDDLLQRTKFVFDDVDACPRGLLISSICSEDEPFSYYENGTHFTDPEVAFHKIRSGFTELYIKISFKDSKSNFHLLSILEDNPHSLKTKTLRERDSELADRILNYTLQMNLIQNIKNQIDQSLDNKNKDEFLTLSKRLNELDQIPNIKFL